MFAKTFEYLLLTGAVLAGAYYGISFLTGQVAESLNSSAVLIEESTQHGR